MHLLMFIFDLVVPEGLCQGTWLLRRPRLCRRIALTLIERDTGMRQAQAQGYRNSQQQETHFSSSLWEMLSGEGPVGTALEEWMDCGHLEIGIWLGAKPL